MADTETVDAVASAERSFNKKGLVAAGVFLVVGVLAARDMAVFSMGYFGASLALGVRSFIPGMSLGRGVLVTLGGMSLGFILSVLLTVGVKDVASLLGPAIIIFVCFGYGFKQGRIRWGFKKAS